jgi:hypothetical protein
VDAAHRSTFLDRIWVINIFLNLGVLQLYMVSKKLLWYERLAS